MKKYIIIILALIFVISACRNKNSQNNEDDTIDSISINAEQLYEKAKLIFYSLPSPIETALIIERANVNYDEELLNPTINVIKYKYSE